MRLVGGNQTESWWLYALAGGLMIGGPLWHELFVNRYPVRPEFFIAPLAAAVIGALIALGGRLAGVVLGTLVFGGLLFAFTDLQIDLRHWITVVVLVAVCLGLSLVFIRRRAAITALALGAFYLSSFITPAARRTPHITSGTAPTDRPVLIHLILDEQWGIGGLRAAGDTITANFLSDFYLTRGFELYEAAYSRYDYSMESIPQSLSLGREVTFNRGATAFGIPYWKSLHNNPYFERLRGLGYDVRVYQSGYLDFCSEGQGSIASCEVQLGNSIANIGFLDGPWSSRGMWILRFFLNTRSQVYKRLVHETSIWNYWVAGGGVSVLRRVTRAIATRQPGTAHFAHALLPHRPIQSDAECKLISDPSRQVGYEYPAQANDSLWQETLGSYAGQVRCAHRLLAELMDAVDSTIGRNRSIVIVHGDHGSRLYRQQPVRESLDAFTVEEVNATYPTLLAVRRPNVAPALHREPTPLQDFIWELARSGFTGSPSGPWQHELRDLPDSAGTQVLTRQLRAEDMPWVRPPD